MCISTCSPGKSADGFFEMHIHSGGECCCEGLEFSAGAVMGLAQISGEQAADAAQKLFPDLRVRLRGGFILPQQIDRNGTDLRPGLLRKLRIPSAAFGDHMLIGPDGALRK